MTKLIRANYVLLKVYRLILYLIKALVSLSPDRHQMEIQAFRPIIRGSMIIWIPVIYLKTYSL